MVAAVYFFLRFTLPLVSDSDVQRTSTNFRFDSVYLTCTRSRAFLSDQNHIEVVACECHDFVSILWWHACLRLHHFGGFRQ
jgi:hypothetical protein